MPRIADGIARSLDRVFGAANNPWHHLGALGFYLFWVATASGVFVYAAFDTSATGAYASVERLTRGQWYVGGLMRSLHRYASDAFVAVMALHLLRELLHAHWRGFRWFSWLTGVPLIWLTYASGIGGYWLVWDQLAQFSIVATAEWLDRLPLGAESVIRNFIHPIDDRFFSLLIFLHIGIPLLLLAGMWLHIQRISHARTLPPRNLGLSVAAMLLAICVIEPAESHAPANPALLQTALDLDWFYMFVHPLQYWTSPGVLWAVAAGATLFLSLLPLIAKAPRPQTARVDPRFCNGCARCADDCPYAAIVMQPRTDARPGQRLPWVDADACAGCGICAGACPSSTPFRSTEELVSGIDMPQLTVGDLRRRLEQGVRAARARQPIVVFGCERAARLPPPAEGVIAFPLICVGMLPPSFVEYALRCGAAGIVVNGCRPGECEFRVGNAWMERRLAGAREPHLRASVDRSRVSFVCAGRGDEAMLMAAVAELRQRTEALAPESRRPRPRRLGSG
ncbi:MAG: hydrogenase iron-sulfur subunit [Betaproteobacteria bacterium]|nr:MAG: hydrogenase iron-sulfur subunit [Betaproteobacteria bacterium]